MLDYKRISRGFWNYALYPADINIDKLITQSGKNKDYYQSIYNYKEEHYLRYVDNLEKACQKFGIKFDNKDLLGTHARVYNPLKTLADKGDKEAQELKQSISVAGTENITTNKLVFDFDSKQIELSQKDTVELCNRILESGIDESCLQICFSGNKGFSVEIDTTQEFSRKHFEMFVDEYSKGLKTFDPKIKDEQRLFRIPLTKHNSSGLYKIPLSFEQLNQYTSDDFKQWASPQSVASSKKTFYELMNSWNYVDHIIDVTKNIKIENQHTGSSLEEFLQEDKHAGFVGTLDLAKKPHWLSATKYALQEGFFMPGERNQAFMILAATYRGNGFSKDIAFNVLKGVAELQHKRTGQEIYSDKEIQHNIIGCVYGDKWKGGTYSEGETDLLKKTTQRFNLVEEGPKTERKLYSVTESLTRFQEYAKNFSKNRIKTGLKSLDDNLVLTSGMTCGLLGAPGGGKTTFSNLFMKYTSQNGEKVLFESLDMSENFIIARYIQNYVDYDFEQIMNMLETGKMTSDLIEAMDKVTEEYANVSINFKTSTNIEDIEKDIIKHKEMFGEVPRLVVIDYLEKIRGPYTDSNANTAYIASRLTDLAKEYNTFILLLLQPQKHAGDPSHPLLSMRKVKGASTIEQDCRVILTMWRPGFDPTTMEYDRFASIAVVKNNMGRLGQYDFSWDGLNGTLRQLTEEEEYQLQQLIDRIEQERSEEETNGW